MTESVRRVDLGPGAQSYLQETLAAGGPLSASLAAQLGRLVDLYTWAPPSADPDLLDERVREGGVLTPPLAHRPGSMIPINEIGGENLASLVTSFLTRSNALFIVDDPWRRPEDIRGQDLSACTVDGLSVIHALGPGSTAEDLEKLLRQILTWEWSGALTTVPGVDFRAYADITRETVDVAATRSEHLVVPAYDHEGWVIVDLSAWPGGQRAEKEFGRDGHLGRDG